MLEQYLSAFIGMLETLILLSPLFVIIGFVTGVIVCVINGLLFLARNNIK